MKERTITSAGDFHDAVRSCRDEYVIVRGEDGEYPLLPKLGRYKAKNWKNFFVKEQHALEEFKRRAAPHLDRTPTNDWQWLAVAQHFGLVTRLLDWSENPLVAVHFAAQNPDLNRDRVIYAFRVGDTQFADTIVSPSKYAT